MGAPGAGDEREDGPRSALIRARRLVKHYGQITAVDGIDLDVGGGESFGVLGPNGAGKTTLMRMVGCVSTPTAGELSVLDMDPVRDGARIRASLGVCPQEDNLDVDLTARENLTTYARYFGISRERARQRADDLLEFMGLTDRADSRVETFSGGMKRRLTIARALINEPELVLLDEPTTGLDPQARHLVWERLFRLKQRGTTLVLTTHYMDEAEQLCDRLAILDRGRIVAEGSPQHLIERLASREVVELRFGTEALEPFAPRLAGLGERVDVLPDRILLFTDDGDRLVPQIYERALRPTGVLVRRASLEDVFLRLTGRQLAPS